MERKFECYNCKTRFEADDAQQATCPNCGSDNVEYAHFHIPAIVWKMLAGVLVILVIGFLAKNIDWEPISGKKATTTTTTEDSIETAFIAETDLLIPPVINVDNLTFEERGYKFEVTVKNPPSVKYYYAVLDYSQKDIIAKSNDGKFKDVPYSNAVGGVYLVSLFDASNDTIICSIEKTGFVKQSHVDKKMTVAELQALIDKRDSSLLGVGANDYLNPDYELTLVGLADKALNVPKTLGEVFDKIENEIWESVKVNSLEYDDMNRISKIVLSVKEF